MSKRKFYKKRKGKSLAKMVRSNKFKIDRLKQDIEVKYVESAVDMELDRDDMNTSVVYFNTDIYRDAAATDPQGGVGRRDGDKIRNKRLHIRGYFDNKNEPAAAEDVLVRIIIGKWIDNSAQTFGMANVLEDSTDINSMRNITNNGVYNYKILFDHTFPMDHVNYQVIPFKATFKLQDHTIYEGQTTSQTITNVRRNLYFIAGMSTASEDADAPHFKFNYRFSFTDM